MRFINAELPLCFRAHHPVDKHVGTIGALARNISVLASLPIEANGAAKGASSKKS